MTTRERIAAACARRAKWAQLAAATAHLRALCAPSYFEWAAARGQE